MLILTPRYSCNIAETRTSKRGAVSFTRFNPNAFFHRVREMPQCFMAVMHEQHMEHVFHYGSGPVIEQTQIVAEACGLNIEIDPNGEWRRVYGVPKFEEVPRITDRPWRMWAERTRQPARGPALPDRFTVKWERWLPAGEAGMDLLEEEDYWRHIALVKDSHPDAIITPYQQRAATPIPPGVQMDMERRLQQTPRSKRRMARIEIQTDMSR